MQGHFIARPFQVMLATTVPLIAKADPKRAQVAAPASDFLNADPDVLDAIAASEITSTGAETASSGKKSKRRKA